MEKEVILFVPKKTKSRLGVIVLSLLLLSGCAFTPSKVPVGYVLSDTSAQLNPVNIFISSDDIPNSKILNFQYENRVRRNRAIFEMLSNTKIFSEINVPKDIVQYSLVIDYRERIFDSENYSNKLMLSSTTLFMVPVKKKSSYSLKV